VITGVFLSQKRKPPLPTCSTELYLETNSLCSHEYLKVGQKPISSSAVKIRMFDPGGAITILKNMKLNGQWQWEG